MTGGVGGANPTVPAAQRIIAMQAMSQAGSCGQSSSQQGIEAIVISAVKALAGCEITVARSATPRKSEKSSRAALPIGPSLLKYAASANGFVVNAARNWSCLPRKWPGCHVAALSGVALMRMHDIKSYTFALLSYRHATEARQRPFALCMQLDCSRCTLSVYRKAPFLGGAGHSRSNSHHDL